MLKKILSLSKSLISLPSTKNNPLILKKVINLVKDELKGFTIEEFEKDGNPSILVYRELKRPKKFKVILNAHLDVVSAKDFQFKPYEKNGRLYGRGAIDMKGSAAVEILVFKELAKKLNYPLGLQLVTDEEIGGFNGTKFQIEKEVRGEFVIAGEPTDFGINNQAKGIIWAKIKTKGKSAHGAYPWLGENALWKMFKIQEKIKKVYPLVEKEAWQTTCNLAKIETSNQTFNKVPDDATLYLDIRYIPEDKKKVLKNLKKIVGKDGRLEIVLKEPAQFTHQNNPYVLKLKKATKKITKKPAKIIVKHGGSDIRHYNQIGVEGVTFGPVGQGLHSDNEWVDIKSLEQYYFILKEFLLNL